MSAAPRGARPKHAPGARRTPFVLLVLGLIGGGMALLLALNTASAANEVRRGDLADSDQGVAASLVQLQNQVQQSAAPDNLAVAAAALGMVPAGNPAFLQIDKSGKVRVLGSAAPASALPVYVPAKSPSPTKTPSKTPSKSASNSKSKSDSTSAPTSSSRSTSSSNSTTSSRTPKPGTSSSAKRKPKSKPTPTSTPTPTITLPGGNR